MVALQALLLPLSIAAGSPFTSSNCTTSVEGSQPPGSHETICPCAAGCGMQCCIHVLNGPAHISAAIADMHANAMTPAPVILAVIRLTDRRGPQIPRAPPSA
jgi:hypothetical protein